jgi:hypothetical protein
MKLLRILTLIKYSRSKIKNKKPKAVDVLFFQGLSNGTTLMQIQSGQTVPFRRPFITLLPPGPGDNCLPTPKISTKQGRPQTTNTKLSKNPLARIF